MEQAEMKEKSITVSPGGVFHVDEEEKQEMKNMISKFPQEESWKVSVNLYKYQDFWYYDFVLIGILLFQKKFVPQPADIFLATTPKSGTTWLKALVFAIQTRTRYINGDSDDHESPLLSKNPHQVVPSIEYGYSFGIKRDRFLATHTHVPFQSLPNSILHSDSKIIYLCRDPKDVLVSQFHFTCKHGDAPVKPFHEVYDKFCNGVTDCGPFWDHVLGYWKASLEFPQKVLFLKYHDLQNDTAFHVKNIANFIGCPFSFNEKQKGMVEEIVRLCSFENLSSLDANNKNAGKVSDNSSFTLRYDAYFRKAKFGDWKNYLTPEMTERIDQITYEKFNDIGLHFL
ncbi:Cytosolic sulfotransferase 6 [Euphorbia peplus]|nr:Cytosolic sulfotransferase 6 [Euphorbia peplus]